MIVEESRQSMLRTSRLMNQRRSGKVERLKGRKVERSKEDLEEQTLFDAADPIEGWRG
jgi:hypothetical protein